MSAVPTPHLTLVVACYNEEPLLERSMADTFRVLDQLSFATEVVFVDDASGDRTREIIDRIIAANPERQLQKIEHATNVGRGGTVSDGIRAARGTYVGFIDIDLEVHARYIPSCVAALEDGYDVATAWRIYKFQLRSADRYVLSTGYHWLVRRLLALPVQDSETGFKFFRRDRILPVLEATEDRGWFWDTELMARASLAGLRIIEIPALFVRRFDKQSSVRVFKDTTDYLLKVWRFRRVLAAARGGRR